MKTQTAMHGIEKVAPLMGISTDEFYHMNRENIISADEMANDLHQYQIDYNKKNAERLAGLSALLDNLSRYYRHQLEMMQGYIKDPEKRREYDTYIRGWLEDIEAMKRMV